MRHKRSYLREERRIYHLELARLSILNTDSWEREKPLNSSLFVDRQAFAQPNTKGSAMKNSFLGALERLKQALNNWRQRIRQYAENCIQSGFIPLTFGPVQFITRQLARLLIFVLVGNVRVIGKENLRNPGRFIFTPNHSSMLDAPVIYSQKSVNTLRYMTAYEEMTGLWGLKAIFMGFMGCFPVDRTRGKSVIEPAIEVLVQGQSLVIFPEGTISENGSCLPFKKGPAIIAMAAYERMEKKERVGIVPVHIYFHKRDVATAKKFYHEMGLKWRGGATLTIGKPLYLDDLAGLNPDEVMAIVHKFVCHAQAEAEQMSCPCET